MREKQAGDDQGDEGLIDVTDEGSDNWCGCCGRSTCARKFNMEGMQESLLLCVEC